MESISIDQNVRSNFLDLRIDEQKQQVKRIGYNATIDLSRSKLGWYLFRMLKQISSAGGSLSYDDFMQDDKYPGERNNSAVRRAVKELKEKLHPLSITIRAANLKLVEEERLRNCR